MAQLRHRLTSVQTACWDRLWTVAESTGGNPTAATSHLDRACLDFCVSLLDDTLHGDIFESPIVSFLAVLGIDEQKGVFYEAATYTPKLSAFIKIAQLLVLQKAVGAAEAGLTPDPIELLDELRNRFLTLDTCTPFTWAVTLRTFGKNVRDCTTSVGYVQWSEDAQTIYYGDIELQIPRFHQFIVRKVLQAQQQLEALFLLVEDESRDQLVPPLALHRLRDNPAETASGWSFLEDNRNHGLLPDRNVWLLQRVLDSDTLRDRFCALDASQTVVWNVETVQQYRKDVDAFLETLLLLIHVSAGQPARGTEITSLQHTNTAFHRNIFLEDGLVALVTTYHKGYTCSGTTKIIHRYLPKEISELVVYYLWLVLPFVEKLQLLTYSNSTLGKARSGKELQSVYNKSPFFWPEGRGTWSSSRLTTILKRETGWLCKTPLTISTYRHVAIALSRRHLTGGGFKRDYGVEETVKDQQTTHTAVPLGKSTPNGLKNSIRHL